MGSTFNRAQAFGENDRRRTADAIGKIPRSAPSPAEDEIGPRWSEQAGIGGGLHQQCPCPVSCRRAALIGPIAMTAVRDPHYGGSISSGEHGQTVSAMASRAPSAPERNLRSITVHIGARPNEAPGVLTMYTVGSWGVSRRNAPMRSQALVVVGAALTR